MAKRLFVLLGVTLCLGLATKAFAAVPAQAPWITREGAVAMLVESKPEWKAQLPFVRATLPPMPIFDDTDQDEWYAPYLEIAFKQGLIAATDFHREFRPGELLKQGEAIALAARYRANGDASLLPHEEPDHPLSLALHIRAAENMGIALPSPLQDWDVIRRADWLALMESAGVHNPGAIAVVPPAPAPVVPTVTPLPAVQPSTQIVHVPALQPARQTVTAYTPPLAAIIPSAYAAPTYTTPSPVSQPTPLPPSNFSQFTISIPALNIHNLTVTHPTDVTTQQGLLAPLQHGLGHLFSYPGHGGTVLIYGHSSSVSYDLSEYTKIFRQINQLNPGDRITITYGGETFTYEVTFKNTVSASDMSAYQGGNGEELILYTCWPPDDVKQRYLVHARPV